MTTQPDLFIRGDAYARHSDPETSHAAAQDMESKANRLESLVLAFLLEYRGGLTSHELVAATGLNWNTLTPRIRPLVRKGLVMDSGERRVGPCGKKCIVWKAR